MKIKVIFLDKDKDYLERLSNIFSAKYNDKLETYMFSDKMKAEKFLEENNIHVFISTQEYDVNINKISTKSEFVYFVDTNEIEMINGEKAICKYQRIDGIYKSILNIFADNNKVVIKKENRNDTTKTIFFTSFSGGVGSSTLAASFARFVSEHGSKVFYLNLEKNGDAEIYFKGEGKYTLSDVIYAVKGKKNNLDVKIESAIKKSKEGVDFFAAPNMVLDFLELTENETMELIEHIANSFEYDYLILDASYDFEDISKRIWAISDKVLIVSDGSEICNSKTTRTYQSILELQSEAAEYCLDNVSIVYNKFSNKTGRQFVDIEMKNIGGIRKFEHANTQQIMDEISKMDMWKALL